MNNFFTQFKNLARTIKLSQNEKQNMRVNLYNYLEQHPMGSFVAPSPIKVAVPSTFYFFSPRYMVPIALLLVVGLSGGTAFAAEGSLPNSPLYAVKIHVNEPVQVAFATTPEAKAQVNASIATTRLVEAETLASNGTLDATTTAELAANFTEHAQAAQTNTSDIESNDPGTAAQLGAEFNGTLAAHGALLAEIGDDSKDDATMRNSNSLAIQVQQEAEHSGRSGDNNDDNDNDGSTTLAIATATSATVTPAVSNGARIRTFAAVAPSATGTATTSGTTSTSLKGKGTSTNSGNGNANDAKVAASLGAQATTSIAAMNADFAAIKPILDANTLAQLTAQIAAVQTQYAQGNFANAIRMATKLDIYFKAGKNINIKLLSGLLNASTSGKGSSGSNSGSNTDGRLPAGGQGNNNGKAPSTTVTATTTSTTSSSSNDNSGKGSDDTNGSGKGGDDNTNSSTVNVGNSSNVEVQLQN